MSRSGAKDSGVDDIIDSTGFMRGRVAPDEAPDDAHVKARRQGDAKPDGAASYLYSIGPGLYFM